ncbi:MAG: D-amino acid aminotransferase [bacterium]|nr:D-amino acid aminotransferase [bacterium]
MDVHLNGDYLPAGEAAISVWDGGYLFGDGIYTTLRTYAGRAPDLAAHHRRLVAHGASLDLAMPVDQAGLAAIVTELTRRNGLTAADGRLRITVSRGGDPTHPLLLTGLADLAPTFLVTLVPVPPEIAVWQEKGVEAVQLPETFARGNRPELKSLNCLTNVLALRRAAAQGCQDAILTGPDGRLLEGAVSNIFLVKDGTVATPAAESGLLAGRTRERILVLLAEAKIPLRTADLHGRDLDTADEAFLASSVREILPLVRVDGRPVGTGEPGPVTRTLQQAYRQSNAADPSGPAAG